MVFMLCYLQCYDMWSFNNFLVHFFECPCWIWLHLFESIAMIFKKAFVLVLRMNILQMFFNFVSFIESFDKALLHWGISSLLMMMDMNPCWTYESLYPLFLTPVIGSKFSDLKKQVKDNYKWNISRIKSVILIFIECCRLNEKQTTILQIVERSVFQQFEPTHLWSHFSPLKP